MPVILEGYLICSFDKSYDIMNLLYIYNTHIIMSQEQSEIIEVYSRKTGDKISIKKTRFNENIHSAEKCKANSEIEPATDADLSEQIETLKEENECLKEDNFNLQADIDERIAADEKASEAAEADAEAAAEAKVEADKKAAAEKEAADAEAEKAAIAEADKVAAEKEAAAKKAADQGGK